jgi:hypothetical protein
MPSYPEMHTMAWRMMLTGAWSTLATDQLDPVKFQAISRLALAVETSNILSYREIFRGR